MREVTDNGKLPYGRKIQRFMEGPLIGSSVSEKGNAYTSVALHPGCQSRTGGNGDSAAHGAAYGIPGVTVDGNDVEAIDEAFQAAYERAKAGDGPTLIECKTYRWLGHWICLEPLRPLQ